MNGTVHLIPSFLQDAWEQHVETDKEEAPNYQRMDHMARGELVGLQKPPNDYRGMSILPIWEDLCLDMEPFLRPNIVQGKYPNADTYLDVQFRLLREDFFHPLRTGIQEYRKQVDRKQHRSRIDNVRFYDSVRILDHDITNDEYTLTFSLLGLEGINWEGSKRLIFGSLLLLTRDHFRTFLLMTVARRDTRQLVQGKLIAHYEQGDLPRHGSSVSFVMAESSVYFEAYRSVLEALQRISPMHLPLKEYILGERSKSDQPDYLLHTEAVIKT